MAGVMQSGYSEIITVKQYILSWFKDAVSQLSVPVQKLHQCNLAAADGRRIAAPWGIPGPDNRWKFLGSKTA